MSDLKTPIGQFYRDGEMWGGYVDDNTFLIHVNADGSIALGRDVIVESSDGYHRLTHSHSGVEATIAPASRVITPDGAIRLAEVIELLEPLPRQTYRRLRDGGGSE